MKAATAVESGLSDRESYLLDAEIASLIANPWFADELHQYFLETNDTREPTYSSAYVNLLESMVRVLKEAWSSFPETSQSPDVAAEALLRFWEYIPRWALAYRPTSDADALTSKWLVACAEPMLHSRERMMSDLGMHY